jgi:hypothetical protein
MRRIALVAMLAALPLAFASPADSVAKRSFHDALGDVDCCTRDLTDVIVRNDDAGTVTFDVHFDATAEGEDDDDLFIPLDTDRDAATGQSGDWGLGVDYMVGLHLMTGQADGIVLYRWDGHELRDFPTRRIRVSVGPGAVRVRLDRHLIGDTEGFRFNVQVWEVAQGNVYADFAPDRGSWSFPVRITSRRLVPSLDTSRRAVAGHRFVARLELRVAGTNRLLGSGRIRCRASVATRQLEPVFAAFAGRRAVCAWKLSVEARGKLLRGSVTVAVDARHSFSRRFSATID